MFIFFFDTLIIYTRDGNRLALFDIGIEETTVLVERVLNVLEHTYRTWRLVTFQRVFRAATFVIYCVFISIYTFGVTFWRRWTFLRQSITTFRVAWSVFVESGEDNVTVRRNALDRLLVNWCFFATLNKSRGIFQGEVGKDFVATVTLRTKIRNVMNITTLNIVRVILVSVEVISVSAIRRDDWCTLCWFQFAAHVVVRMVDIQQDLIGTTSRRISGATVLMHLVLFQQELLILTTLLWILTTTHVYNRTSWVIEHIRNAALCRILCAAATVLLVIGSILHLVHTLFFAHITFRQVLKPLLFTTDGLFGVGVIIKHILSTDFRGLVTVLLEPGCGSESVTALGVFRSLLLLRSHS